MSIIKITDAIAGTTIKPTWCSSGVTPTALYSRILDNAETQVSSCAGISSGNGFYYALHGLPNSNAWYVNEWLAVINANTYISRQFIHGLRPEVD